MKFKIPASSKGENIYFLRCSILKLKMKNTVANNAHNVHTPHALRTAYVLDRSCSVLPALCGQRALRTTMAQPSAQ